MACLLITRRLWPIIIIFRNNAMGKRKIILVLVFLLATLGLFSQEKDQAGEKQPHFSLAVGTGWTHYIDNLDYGNKNLTQDFAGFNFRFYWEPEYRLSLGAETGSYTMFRANSQPGSSKTGEITRKVTPFFLLVRMRIVDQFYLGTGFGFASLNNTTTYADQEITTKTTSLSNYQFSASYIYPLKKHWQLGGEAKLYNFGAYNDWMYTLQVFCAWRF